MIDAAQLAASVGCSVLRAARWLDMINATLSAYRINTPVRQAAFLAQLGHESGGLQYVRELWGPSPAQRRYEGRLDLGNTKPGDGERFKGHGLIQITGRANHAAARDGMRERLSDVPDFEVNPEALEIPKWAALSAGWFWDSRGLNVIADTGNFDAVCDIVNRGHKTDKVGDSNGYAERLRLYGSARRALGLGGVT